MAYIKNIDTVANTYQGQQISAGEFYQIQDAEGNGFANDNALLIDIANAKAQISETGQDAGLISGVSDQINFLKKLNLVKTQQILSQDGLTSRPFGFSFNGVAGQTTTHNFKLVESVALRGGTLETEGVKFGDSFDVAIVDIDNVLGYGAGFVLFDFIKDWQCHRDNFNELREETITNKIPVNVYVQVKYKSTGTVDVPVAMNMFGYK